MHATEVIFVLIVIAVFVDRARRHAGGTRLAGGKKPVSIKGTSLVVGGKTRPLYGVQAEAIAAGSRRTTGTRVAVGTVLAPGVGTVVGAMAKKHENVVVVTGPDWSETIVFKDIGKATLAARRINAAAVPASSTGSH